VCRAGAFGACEGQVLPAEEACGNALDDDCDGQIDEGCDLDPCPVDPNSPVTITATCLAVGSSAQSLVMAEIRDLDGNPMPDVTVSIEVQPAVPSGAVGHDGDRWYRLFTAGFRPGESQINVTARCEDGPPVALNTTPSLSLVAQPAADGNIVTGGCADPEGNLLVYVTDADTGAPIVGASVMAGPQRADTLIRGTLTAVRGNPGVSPNRGDTNANGLLVLRDLGDTIDGPQIVTAGAPGYEYVTLVDVGASVVRLALRPSDPPPAPEATLSGRLADFNDLSRDGQTDAALVLAPFDLPLLARMAIPRLLSRNDCWDPVTGGFVGGLVPELGVPGNIYVPGQGEALFGLPVTVEEHPFVLDGIAHGEVPIVGLAGKLPSDNVGQLAGGGGSLSGILEMMTFHEMGVQVPNVAGDIAGMAIPLSIDLAQNATCRLSNLPADTTALCTTAGDWSGANGAGALFPMGLASGDPMNGAVEFAVTTAPAAGVMRGISYLAAAVGMYATDGAPEGLLNAATAMIDRSSIDGNGGVFEADSFLGTTTLTRDFLSFAWNPVARPESPAVDVCRVDVVRIVRTIYNPGACSPNLADTHELPVWSVYVSGDPGAIDLPILPPNWPRGATSGLVDPSDTPADDRLEVRVSCMHLGDAVFDFDAGNFGALLDGLTHLSINQVRF
jgi:hypothetical protein